MAKKTYEELVERLEEIVNKTEREEISIDESLKLYKEGLDLAVKCNKILLEYDIKANKIKNQSIEKLESVKHE